jgi:hypothetical protein
MLRDPSDQIGPRTDGPEPPPPGRHNIYAPERTIEDRRHACIDERRHLSIHPVVLLVGMLSPCSSAQRHNNPARRLCPPPFSKMGTATAAGASGGSDQGSRDSRVYVLNQESEGEGTEPGR